MTAENGAATSTADSMRIEALFRALRLLSADLEPQELLRSTLHAAVSLYRAQAASIWVRTAGKVALRIAGAQGLTGSLAEGAERLGHRDGLVDMATLAEDRIRDIADTGTIAPLAEAYAAAGIGTVLVLPLVAHAELIGALVLYGADGRRWSPADLDLAPMFARQLASVVAGALLLADARSDTARLRAIQDLSWRLNRIQDMTGIGEAIVAEADKLIDHDTIRVYRVDVETGMCEPIAFQGEFFGIGRPSAEQLRVRIGDGVTGWVAAHSQTVRLADAANDARGRLVGNSRGVESMLAVPIAWEARVMGVVVVSREGFDHFSDGDQRMLEVFAGYAAQSMVRSEALAALEHQRLELANRLDRQHRLLEINERLLATLEPTSVLGLIADSLGALIAFDSLAIYRLDREAGVRRAMIVRDPDANAIFAHAPSIDSGINGWAIARAQSVLTNEAHLDPRAMQIPGTPVTPESLIVCPLLADTVTVGTLNVARLGPDRQRFSPDEFELVRLFATQASIAMRNAEAHGAVRVAAEHDPLTGLRNRGAFARDTVAAVDRGLPFALLSLDLDHFKAFNDTLGHQAGDDLLQRIGDALREAVRGSDLAYRQGGDEFALIVPGATRAAAAEIAGRVQAAIMRAGVEGAPVVGASVGIALFPDDARSATDLVALADRAMYAAKRNPA